MQTIRDVQDKILYVMKYIDKICRENNIEYYIMGGTALGAIRHGGFIPWDDDLDIFMTPQEYYKFKIAFNNDNNDEFYLQEWKTTPNFLEYSKVRLNGTTFIEKAYKDDKTMHQGIYVDIMMLHKVPNKKSIQKSIYFKSKYVALYGNSKRGWRTLKGRSFVQKIALLILKIMPNKFLLNKFYKQIYKYDDLKDNFKYSYWITRANFEEGLFDEEMFTNPIDIEFEDTKLLGSKQIKKYLIMRYGDYMKMPSKEQQKSDVHAYIFDVNKDYKEYIKNE